MLIAIAKEITPLENRVALVPRHVAILKELGHRIAIQTNAGQDAGFNDEDYRAAGAEICASPAQTYQNADIILKIWAPLQGETAYLSAGQKIICNAQNIKTTQAFKTLADRKIDLFALDLMPRLSRAQDMDILSSQNNLAGYAAVLTGIQHCPSVMPLMITSAGTLPPLKVLIMGLGVAGLQALATAHRLGAQLYALDNRPETEEQAASLGAVFVHQLTDDLLSTVQLLITSALITGKPAPKLLTAKQLGVLPPHCVIIDMAADSGGNIPTHALPQNITLISDSHLARRVPTSASILYSGNVFNFFRFLYPNTDSSSVDFNDEIISTTAVCNHGQCHHPYLMTGK